AILMADFAVPYWLTVPVSAALCGCFGFLLGFPALRLGGVYLALTTFATAVAVPQILKSSYLEGWTGGVQGIVISKPDPPFDLPLTADQWLYLFSLALASALFLVAYNLVTGRTGRALIAIRDHALAAEAMGVNTALLKTGVFAVSALYTGIAGSLGAIAVEFVSPDSFTVLLSIVLFVGLVAGGIASILGPVFGGLFIVFVPAVAERISKAAPDAVYGLILIGFMYLMPFGIAGFVESLILRISASEGGGE
ncbi:MAG: branched-chain amino acid ABC transporter permease, partial [Acetobacteraceae bacterium]|nr:branched-chain amino acid ABC transporter permease [Acetobacteraceae bacterium]